MKILALICPREHLALFFSLIPFFLSFSLSFALSGHPEHARGTYRYESGEGVWHSREQDARLDEWCANVI